MFLCIVNLNTMLKQVTITFPMPEFQEMLEGCMLKVLQSHNKVVPTEEKEFIKRTEAAKLLKISLPSLTKFSKPKEHGGLDGLSVGGWGVVHGVAQRGAVHVHHLLGGHSEAAEHDGGADEEEGEAEGEAHGER